MAERENTTALVPTNPLDGEYMIEVKEFDQSGKSTKLSVAVPDTSSFNQWNLLTRAVLLKKGPWSSNSIYEIVFAIAYADNMGLDIMRGDVFSTGNGRIGISNKAKIKKAQDTGNIEGIEVAFRELPDDVDLKDCKRKKDLECTATVWVKGWKKPIVRTQRLSEWFNARNPNWAGRPEHMLELNTVAHACEYVPGASLVTEDTEAPPLPTPDISKALEQAKESAGLTAVPNVSNDGSAVETPSIKTTKRSK